MAPKNTFIIANDEGCMGAGVLATSRRSAWRQAREASGMTVRQLRATGMTVRRVTLIKFERAAA